MEMRCFWTCLLLVSCFATVVHCSSWLSDAIHIEEAFEDAAVQFIQVDMQAHVAVSSTQRRKEDDFTSGAGVSERSPEQISRAVIERPDMQKAVELGLFAARASFPKLVGDADPVAGAASASGTAGSEHAIARFISKCVGTTILVLLMCGDDLCWLLPFCVDSDKFNKAGFYVLCMAFMWFLAWIIYSVAQVVQVSHPSLPIEEITDVASTLLLIGLTTKFYFEWLEEDEEDEEEEKDAEQVGEPAVNDSSVVANADGKIKDDCSAISGNDGEKVQNATSNHARTRNLGYWKLFLVSLGGNFDNIGVYVPVLLSQVFTPAELLIGDCTAAVIIALITLGLSQFKILTDFFTKVPLWVIVGVLTACVAGNTVYTLVHPN